MSALSIKILPIRHLALCSYSKKLDGFLYSLVFSFVLLSFSGDLIAKGIHYWQGELAKADQLYNQGLYSQALDKYRYIAEETASKYAQFQVAWIYHNGLGVEENCNEAARWYTFAANSGYPMAQNNLSVLYADGCSDMTPNPALSVKYLEMASASGSARAQANLAIRYANGEGVVENPYQAYDLARRSAEQGDITGMYNLATFHLNGIGVPKNVEKATILLEQVSTVEAEDFDKATKQAAQLLLGELYMEGEGVTQNQSVAYKWLLLASSGPNDQLTSQAKNYLGKLENKIPKEQMQQVQASIEMDSRKSTTASTTDLIEALTQAISDERKTDAIQLANLLNERENPRGRIFLGLMYAQGYGSIEVDLDEAYILFKRACKDGDWEGCALQVDSLLKMNRVSAAKELLENISDSTPETDDMQNLLAELYINTDDLIKAEIVVRKVLIGDPINEKATELLERIQSLSAQ